MKTQSDWSERSAACVSGLHNLSPLQKKWAIYLIKSEISASWTEKNIYHLKDSLCPLPVQMKWDVSEDHWTCSVQLPQRSS